MERKGFQSKDRGFSKGREQDREPQKMYKAKCSDCGQDTEVPFKPDPERPVYCKECYSKRKPKRY